MISTAAFLLTGAVAAVMIAKRHRLAERIAAPLHSDSGHSPRRVLFFAGLAVLGVNLVLEGASGLSLLAQYALHTSVRTQLAEIFVYPSVQMAIGGLLFFLQPILAYSLAPGRED